MGSLFGKGGGSAAPPPMPDYSAMITQQMTMFQEMMGGMMEMMMGMMASMPDMGEYMDSMLEQQLLEMPEMPSLLDMPQASRDPEIDWGEKQDQLSMKQRADYNREEMLRKGRTDTIHTSPLLDEEYANVSGSIIASK